MDQLIPTIIDCECGLRYMRTASRTPSMEIGHACCACGNVIGAWNGRYKLYFEPEDGPIPRSFPRH